MGSVVIVVADAVPKWISVIRGKREITLSQNTLRAKK